MDGPTGKNLKTIKKTIWGTKPGTDVTSNIFLISNETLLTQRTVERY